MKMKKLIIKWLFGEDWEEYLKLHRDYLDAITKNLKLLDENVKLYDEIINQAKEMIIILERDTRIIQDNKSLYEICKANNIEMQKDDYFSLN